MSDSQAQSYSPAPKATKTAPKRTRGVLLWLLVLVLALAAFGGALWYAGGTDAFGQLGGLVSSFMPSFAGGSGSQQPAPAAPAAVPATATVLPPEAEARMFAEQIASNAALRELVEGRITMLELGKPQQSDTSATVPLTATYSGGTKVSGVLTFKKYRDAWYFVSLTAAKRGDTSDQARTAFDSGVVSTITKQQAQPGTQEIVTHGILGGGYTTVTVDGVKMGPRTATVDVTLSGGTQPESKGRLVCISKTDGATTYWFVASFEKR